MLDDRKLDHVTPYLQAAEAEAPFLPRGCWGAVVSLKGAGVHALRDTFVTEALALNLTDVHRVIVGGDLGSGPG